MRYKLSKKRCNLYVKNIPEGFTNDDLKVLFQEFGEIESVKVLPEEKKALYAFVCFKAPDSALRAKEALHNRPLEGKQLYVNNYEIREFRQQHNQELKDKSDFNNYMKEISPASTNI